MALTRVGETLGGKWTIDRLVDVGGMASVFAATHRNGKKVAIKMLHPFLAVQSDVRERFLREGYVANQVDHPGALSVLDDDVTDDGLPFLVMELLEGRSMESWLTAAGGTLEVRDVLAIADQVLSVLAAFHAAGVVHRDIKPGNLFVMTTGRIKVLDFGLARLRSSKLAVSSTAAGIVLGTASYMPPEQAQGKSDLLDARADVFAVGAVMFRALTGRPVHDASSVTERLVRAMKEKAPSLRDVSPRELPSGVAEVVDKALAFSRDDRWESAAAMRRGVRDVYMHIANDSTAAPMQGQSPVLVNTQPPATDSPLQVTGLIAPPQVEGSLPVLEPSAVGMREWSEPSSQPRAPSAVPPPLPARRSDALDADSRPGGDETEPTDESE